MIGIVLAALLWGTTGTAATLLPDGIGPLATGASTMAVGGLLLALTAPRATTAVLRSGGAWRWVVPGALCTAVYPLAFYSGMSLAGVAIGNVTALGTAPVFALVLELLFEPAERRPVLTVRWAVSGAAAVLGVALLSVVGHGGASAGPGGQVSLGVGLGLLAGLTYAGYSYTAARLMREGHASRGAVAAQFGLGGLVLVPVLLVVGRPVLTGSGTVADTPLAHVLGPVPPLAVLAYLAIGPMFLAYVAFGRGLRTVPSSRATTVTLLEPFVATILAVLAVGERLGPLGWVALALVLGGVVLTATEPEAPGPVPVAAGP
ncbi:DMT family transporter [Brachybacterium huguangmaarense]|uniref:DMT family transporter n=1 Tax=Brachybacterium huguangmaarense TaxID=1652028 RepID=A0ABY6G340_9MICO|nr:DMT family transporter [Brachybacterium huguangmaarense]UYG17624.1 DMT family transporter [Brachybacterium huguangmaarense]